MRLALLPGPRFSILLMLACTIGSSTSAQPTRPETRVGGNTAFAVELYAQLQPNPGNLFFSPYSISIALAMTYAGARGETKEEMRHVLHFDADPSLLHESFDRLQHRLDEAGKLGGIQLNIVNALWAQKGYPFLADFLETAKSHYHANLNQADFRTEAETSRKAINDWATQETHDRIQDLLPPGSIKDQTRLVLANAIYFKAAWAKPYEKSQTSTQPFHLSTTEQVQVPLMHQTEDVNYAENADFQVVEVPYRGDKLSMVILLPRQVDACSQLEKRLTPSLLASWLAELKHQRVEIFFPRFKLESGLNLKTPLSRLGMPTAFKDATADFSGMDGTRRLHISDVFHKAWGEVNEEGTEAAAATGVVMVQHSLRLPAPIPTFRADHPFVFLIRHTSSGSVLFLGRLANPAG